jgi:hypothetical protein
MPAVSAVTRSAATPAGSLLAARITLACEVFHRLARCSKFSAATYCCPSSLGGGRGAAERVRRATGEAAEQTGQSQRIRKAGSHARTPARHLNVARLLLCQVVDRSLLAGVASKPERAIPRAAGGRTASPNRFSIRIHAWIGSSVRHA